jgi:hypothetical protein
MPGKNQREQLRIDRERAKQDKERARRNQLYLDFLDAVEKGEKRNFEQYKAHQNYISKRDAERAKAREEEEKITKQRIAQAKIGAKTANLTAKVNKLLKSGAGEILKQSNLTETLNTSIKQAEKSTGDVQKGYNLITEAQLTGIQAIKDGGLNAEQFMADLKEQFEGMSEEAKAAFNSMRDDLKKFAEDAEKSGDGLRNALNIDAKDLDGLEGAREKLKQLSAIVTSPALMGAAVVGVIVKGFTELASSANQIRQDLGLSVGESISLGSKTAILSKAFSLIGGDGEQIAAFSKAIASEFGSINQLSFKTLTNFGLISLRTGISGDNAAKLAKSIQSIQGGTLETSLNTISTFENLSRAAGVAPKLVLDDIAESTELFAKFAKDGGENLAKAAIEARKLGLNLSAVDKISESILDFESSIEKQMEASVLLGRQLNLDRARQLAIEGDLEGVLTEVKNQVGGAEQLSKMNVIQRKALADAVGLEVSELSKLAAGQENVNKLSNSQFAALGKTFVITAGIATLLGGLLGFITGIIAPKRLATGIAGGISGLAMGAKIGVAGGAVVAGAQAMLPKAETGGIVTKTGLAEIHKGEAISGTKNELGFGVDMTETNRLLKQSLSESKQLREQNLQLMNRLTNRVGDLALSS